MGQRDLPKGTVTFLFTDIEGSTALWEQDQAAMREAVNRHLTILQSLITAHHGVLYKTVGDGTQAAFASAEDALRAAVAAQRALLQETWADLPGPLRVRMAIHVGDAEPHHGDYLAPALNRLARLLGAGHGGQILLTAAAAVLARDALPPRVSLRDLGEHRLRDLQHPESVFQVLHPTLPADFPPLKSLDIPRHNLPLAATRFIGREATVEQVVSLLAQSDVRLVTITGPGGVGKTRLALQAAEPLIADFAHGVWFVDLSSLDDPAYLLPTIARTLEVPEEPGRALLDVLKEQLSSRSLLLVLDNLEQLLPAAPVVSQLLAAIPGLKVLATSRSPLRLRGEREIELAPLSLPEPGTLSSGDIDAINQSEAVQLFLARATSVKPGFTLTDENASAVAEICRRLDGLPLAIELAAARVRILPPRDLLNRLDDRLRLLTGGPRDAPTRHQTLRQAIAWSHDLLDPDEQALLRRIAIFAGHPTLSAIEEVADPDGALDALNGLASLVEKSLIQSVNSDSDEPRFAMLQNIRAFGLEQLASQGETDDLAVAHAHYYAGLATEANTKLFGAEQGVWLARLEADHDDLRGSLRRLVALEDIDQALRFAGVTADVLVDPWLPK